MSRGPDGDRTRQQRQPRARAGDARSGGRQPARQVVEHIAAPVLAEADRLARSAGLRRGRAVVTTRRDPGADRAPELVKRHFVADRPNALWVTDQTYVATWAGVAYGCFTG